MTEEFNFKEEVGKLKEAKDYDNNDWWKSSPGKHVIVILTNPVKFTTEWEGKTINKVRVEMELNKVRFNWGITIGETENSLYGQLMLVGENVGTLIGEIITLVVKGVNKKTSYTIIEALDLMEPAKPKQEEVKEEVVE